jgi:hypothetical protein
VSKKADVIPLPPSEVRPGDFVMDAAPSVLPGLGRMPIGTVEEVLSREGERPVRWLGADGVVYSVARDTVRVLR